MRLAAFERVASALETAQVHFVVVGGLAVNAHGYLRFTADIDIVVALETEHARKAFDTLTSIGYRPIVPVTAAQFADRTQRQKWIDEKGMQVLSFFSDEFPETSVDLFVAEPFDISRERAEALEGLIAPGLKVAFASIPTLIRMKRAAGRARDIDDIEHLQMILDDRKTP